jgi:hypothetical protein
MLSARAQYRDFGKTDGQTFAGKRSIVNQLLEKESNQLHGTDGGATKSQANDLSLQLVKLIVLNSHYAQQWCKRLESIIVPPADCTAIENTDGQDSS